MTRAPGIFIGLTGTGAACGQAMCRTSASAAAGPTAPGVHSEVTAAVPNRHEPHAPLPAGLFTGIGYGKLIGMTQLVELGTLEIPVVLT
ncbi:P1 family peptidase [Streptomyces sp. NPDC001231]|uniref:P1 family peptidase n=1 Tax=Streptomyces sp. NPDC001231 TaxID=3364549 RepID=UPI003688A360